MINAAIVYLAVPLLGLAGFQRLRRNTRHLPDARSLNIRLFLLFVFYGGWLLVALTSLLWVWSGAASLGVGVLVFIAPLVLFAMAVISFPARRRSRIHGVVFWAAALYTPIAALGIAIAVQCCGGPP